MGLSAALENLNSHFAVFGNDELYLVVSPSTDTVQ